METYLPLAFFGWILGAPLVLAVIDRARMGSAPRRDPSWREPATTS